MTREREGKVKRKAGKKNGKEERKGGKREDDVGRGGRNGEMERERRGV